MKISRRGFLGRAALALPALELFGERPARAAGAGPKRLLLLHTPQGTSLPYHIPSGNEDQFTLPFILEPLAPYQDRAIFLAGLDNRIASMNIVGNPHEQANFSLWTGMPVVRDDTNNTTSGGPSIEQVMADRIGGGTPFSRLDLCAGGPSSNGIYIPNEGTFFWYGAGDPVACYNDPQVALLRIFGDPSLSPADAAAQRARRVWTGWPRLLPSSAPMWARPIRPGWMPIWRRFRGWRKGWEVWRQAALRRVSPCRLDITAITTIPSPPR
jgi:hypothetical protein